MITFKNKITNNIFTLPKDKAVAVIKQTPEIFEVLSKVDKDLFEVFNSNLPKDLSKDIYDLVVQDRSEDFKEKKSQIVKKRVIKPKSTKVKRKGK